MLKLQRVDDSKQYIKLSLLPVTLGRDANNDFVIDDPHVADFHAEIHRDHEGLYIVDLLGTGGTFVNEHRISARHRLNSWDVIRLATVSFEINDPNTYRAGCWVLKKKSDLLSGQFYALQERTLVGRDPDCHLMIDWHLLSRRHAEIHIEDHQLRVVDLGSRNGTFINGKRIQEGFAKPKDELRFEEQAYIVFGPENYTGRHNDDDLTGFRESISERTTMMDDMTSTLELAEVSAAVKPKVPEACLTPVVDKGREGHAFLLNPYQQVTIGRAADNDFLVADPSVSKHHAVLRCCGDTWLLSDNHSRNGVLVNGVPITETALKNGDVVAIGVCEIRFEIKC